LRDPARILVADDTPANVRMLETRLAREGYEVCVARDGEETLAIAREAKPDLILLDIMMPKVDGIEVCRRLKGDASLPFTPIIMVTALTDTKDVVAGLEAGGDDYLTKPIDAHALLARVKSMLRIKSLHDTVRAQALELERWNATLEERVKAQLAELERISRLKRFFSPQLAQLILQGGAADPLQSHRREVTVVFLDLRGFTAFAEAAEPEDVMNVLREYHACMGKIVLAHEGTLERFTGDGVVVFFNDPIPVDDAPQRALRMAVAIRGRVGQLTEGWQRQGYALALGVGIAQGHATLGRIGFEGRIDYAAIGSVTNLAARLCAEASAGQILISQRVHAAADGMVTADWVGELALRGFSRPTSTYNVVGLDEARARV
jgi:adenylate cyclase